MSKRSSPVIAVHITDKDVAERARILMGGKTLHCRDAGNPRWKPTFGFAVCGRRAIGWMLTLYTFMGIRRRQKIREIVTEWARVKSKRRSSYDGDTKRRREIGQRLWTDPAYVSRTMSARQGATYTCLP